MSKGTYRCPNTQCRHACELHRGFHEKEFMYWYSCRGCGFRSPVGHSREEAERLYKLVANVVITVAQITMKGSGSYIVYKPDGFGDVNAEVEAFLAHGEVGDSMTITLDEMTEKQFDDLPEFTGW